MKETIVTGCKRDWLRNKLLFVTKDRTEAQNPVTNLKAVWEYKSQSAFLKTYAQSVQNFTGCVSCFYPLLPWCVSSIPGQPTLI